ncbi:MAG: hypothetical protein LBV69_02770 [Bacteroidales bacterium]|jgi:hypothetical protein|nr:hypothetical protein [Bacteroidales bacterium]
MKKAKRFFNLLAIMLVCVVLSTSCDKDKPNDDNNNNNNNNNNTTSYQKAAAALTEYAQVGKMFSDVFSESGKRVQDNVGKKGVSNSKDAYPIVTVESFSPNWLVTIDYGTTDFVCQDNYLRRGKIIVVTTGLFYTQGTVMDVSFDNFYQQNYKIDGQQHIVNAGTVNGEMIFNCTVTDGEITIPVSNKVVHYTETTTRKWIQNQSINLCDNIWKITGNWIGMSSDSVNYTLNTQTASELEYKVCCFYFREGILEVNIDGLQQFTIDYGYNSTASDCDNKAQITYPGINSFEVVMGN